MVLQQKCISLSRVSFSRFSFLAFCQFHCLQNNGRKKKLEGKAIFMFAFRVRFFSSSSSVRIVRHFHDSELIWIYLIADTIAMQQMNRRHLLPINEKKLQYSSWNPNIWAFSSSLFNKLNKKTGIFNIFLDLGFFFVKRVFHPPWTEKCMKFFVSNEIEPRIW